MCHCPPGDRASVWRNPVGTCQHPTLTPMLLAAGGHSEGLSRCAPDNPSARHGTETEWPPSPAHAADLEAAPCPRRPTLPIGQAGPQAPRRASRAPGAASCVHGDGRVAREGSGGRQAPHAPVHARSHMHTHYTHAHTCTSCTHANRRTHIRLAESNTQTRTHARHTRGRARPGSAPSAPAEEPLGSWV